MASKWSGQSKGSVLGYKIFVWVIKRLGVSTAYFLLRFVGLYYFIFSSKQKRDLISFYRVVFPDRPGSFISRLARRNFMIFGRTLIDRIAYLVGRGDRFKFESDDHHKLRKFVEAGQGAFLISAHFGNWSIAGSLLNDLDAKVNVVLFDNEYEKLKEYMERTAKFQFNVIPIKNDFSHLIRINNAIRDGEFVCIHADRFLPGAKTLESTFFGKKVRLPQGPFQMASALKAPCVFTLAAKKGKFGYEFFASDPSIGKDMAGNALEFCKFLETKVREFPEQWFNYYDFFEEDAVSQ